jgi:glycosyltransferase involved in cell wall biosynthesis
LGTIAVTTNISGIPELIRDKKTGYFFHSKNEFLRIIKEIFNKYPENIAINGRKKIEKEFDIDKIIRDKLRELL